MSALAAALFFLFSPTTVAAGEQATVRTAGTPANFAPLRSGSPVRLYLVRNDVARRVKRRTDARLFYVGTLWLNKTTRGSLRFTVPPLDTGDFAVAASRGRTFVNRASKPLRVIFPAATCPVTRPNGSQPPFNAANRSPNFHGNGSLWSRLPLDGVLTEDPARVDPDGTFFEKVFWWANGVTGRLRATAERLDRSAAIQRSTGISGSSAGFHGSASWATRFHFPPDSCWRITARVQDISLAYVVKVVTAARRLNALR